MAYKFQLGAANLSGSITAEGALSGTTLSADTALAISEGGTGQGALDDILVGTGLSVSNGAGTIIGGDATISLSAQLQAFHGLANDDGNFVVGNGSTFVVESGATARSSLGLGSAAVAASSDFLAVASNLSDLNNAGTARTNLGVAIGVDVEAHSDKLTELATMAQNTADALADLSNTEVQLLDGAVATNNAGAVKVAVLDASNNLTIAGDLIVQGTTTTVESTTLTVADNNIVLRQGGAGNADGIGFTFGSTSDTQTLQTVDSSGTQKLGSSLPLSASAYYGDGSNLSGVQASHAASLRLQGADFVINSNISGSQVKDITLIDTTSAAITVTMPDITNSTVGRVYVIKDIVGNAASSGRAISIMKSAAGHTIDDAGNNAVMIESNFGAVNLLACSASGGGFFYSIF